MNPSATISITHPERRTRFVSNKTFLLTLCLLLSFLAKAQTISEKLEALKWRYTQAVDSSANSLFDPETRLITCTELVAKAEEIIQDSKEGTLYQKNTARMIKVHATYMAILEFAKSSQEQYSLLMRIKQDADVVRASNIFPVVCTKDSRKKTIALSYFVNSIYYKYYKTLSSYLVDRKEYDKARQYQKMLWENEMELSFLNRAEAGNNILTIDKLYGKWTKESMEILYAVAELVSTKLGADKQKYLRAGNTPITNLAYIFLIQLDSVRGVDDAGEKAYNMARFLSLEPLRSDWDVWKLYQYALNKGVHENDIYSYCIAQLKSGTFVIQEDEDDHSKECDAQMKEACIPILVKFAKTVEDDNCSGLQKVYDEFTFLGDLERAADYKERLDRCNKKQQKNHQKWLRNQARADKFSHIYLGIYPFPLIFSNVELQADLRSRKAAHSIGYGLIRERMDWNARLYNKVGSEEDLTWYGYRFNYAFKGFTVTGQPSYIGVMFEYAHKNFRVPLVEATVDNTPGTYTFKPVEHQFEAFFLTGFQALKRVMGTELMFAVGGSFNIFNGGNEIWGKPNVVIDNKFLATRKAVTIYPQFKLYWSFGFHLHRRGVKL